MKDANAAGAPPVGGSASREITARTFVPHMAVLSSGQRPNTRAAIADGLAAGVARIELDIHSLAGDDYIVSHARKLEEETTGRGSVGGVAPGEVRAARFIDSPDDGPVLLSEVVAMARGGATEMQLDLKDWRPMAGERISVLMRLLAPIRGEVIVSTGQDWNLRRLHETDAALRLGFDPGLYLDYGSPGDRVYPPRHLGAYGYRDDHPLAFGRTEAPAVYLDERMHTLRARAPAAREWFVSYRLVEQMLADGFDPMGWLAARGVETNVWTLDYSGDESRAVLARIVTAGVSRVTTNTTQAWLRALSLAEPVR
jgi:glycerophosphoryl diester phosphodiesterase